jgi:fatty acid desaturase
MKFWRYSALDCFLFLAAVSQWWAILVWAYFFEALPWWAHTAIIPVASLIFYFNPIVITHNFLHTPFFQSRWLNNLFSIWNSGNLLMPQSLYKHHHLVHHRYSNDPIGAESTLDPSSTWRYGNDGKQENVVRYCALSLFREGTSKAFEEMSQQNGRPVFFIEVLGILATLGLWLWLSWKFVVLVMVPVFYFGWFLALLENYYEHFAASSPTDRYANSVTYLGPIYNILMFNEGYHQAHHIQPGRHWRLRPEIHNNFENQMLASSAYVARFPPLLGFFD